MKKQDDIVVPMDDDGNVVPKDRATQVRILTTDDQGNRREIHAFIGDEYPKGKTSSSGIIEEPKG
jgi:hypothetical protein